MKQGSTDDPFAEDPQEETPDEEVKTPEENGGHSEDEDTGELGSTQSSGSRNDTEDKSTGGLNSLPYIYARDSVKDGRQQRPIFLRDEVEAGIPELVDELESSFGEDVYRTDVLEAAVVVAQRNPTLVKEALEEWGYGWK
jgi:hypothetical protein